MHIHYHGGHRIVTGTGRYGFFYKTYRGRRLKSAEDGYAGEDDARAQAIQEIDREDWYAKSDSNR